MMPLMMPLIIASDYCLSTCSLLVPAAQLQTARGSRIFLLCAWLRLCFPAAPVSHDLTIRPYLTDREKSSRMASLVHSAPCLLPSRDSRNAATQRGPLRGCPGISVASARIKFPLFPAAPFLQRPLCRIHSHRYSASYYCPLGPSWSLLRPDHVVAPVLYILTPP